MLVHTLVLLDPPGRSRSLAEALDRAGSHVTVANGSESLWVELDRGDIDLVVAGSSLLPTPWSRTLARIRALPERPEVVVIVDDDRPEERASLQAAGAFAVVQGDLDHETLDASLRTILRRYRELAVSRLRVDEDRDRAVDPVSRSPAMRKLLDLARRVAAADSTLLVLGETGVGKEWLARAIHAESPRAAAPFVPVNCAAVPDSLIESELFGHEAGAFTGATRARRGAFEMAHRGTLFLDEVGDLPSQLQGKLLRALQDRSIQRLGAERPVAVDVRIVAATNRDLEAARAAGSFRADLFYRLSVVTLRIPPLRERREDVRPLAEAALEHFRSRFGRPRLLGFRPEGLRALEEAPWPGNVRELINTVERAVLLAEGEWIGPEDLLEGPGGAARRPLAAPTPPGPDPPPEGETLAVARQRLIESFERDYLDRLLRRFAGRIDDTARQAAIDPRTLYNKMRTYGLRKEDYR